jgi:DNA-binding CsgD family transcriptional regulator
MNDRRPTEPTGDTLDRTLREVRDLLESTVFEHRARRARDTQVAEVGAEDAAFRAAAEQVVRRADVLVDAVLPAAAPRLAGPHAALTGLLADLDDAYHVRVLRAPTAPDPGPRCQVRIAAVPLPTLLVADGRTALVGADSAGGRQSSIVQDAMVVQALHGMFLSLWDDAAPTAEPPYFGSPARAEMARRVLARLRDGVTDEAAARELGVSVRTYRRHVTGILELLGATSRFQAGVRATELGILKEH